MVCFNAGRSRSDHCQAVAVAVFAVDGGGERFNLRQRVAANIIEAVPCPYQSLDNIAPFSDSTIAGRASPKKPALARTTSTMICTATGAGSDRR